MGLTLSYIYGQTPLDEEEKEDLLIKTITTKNELDEFEQQNIEEAIQWTLSKKFSMELILSEKFIFDLHKRMFGNVWRWAGTARKTNKNIGVDKLQIAVQLRQVLDDCKYWIINKTFLEDEIALRFKHRVVQIHCFPNGNGRHSRLLADVVASHIFKRDTFSWGENILGAENNARLRYLTALREADKGNYQALINFARPNK